VTTERDEPVRYTVLSVRAIAVWSALVVLAGVGVAVWLLLAYTDGNAEGNRLRLDAIRTAGTIVVGTGGAAALLLAARRQRSAEIALRQKDRDQADVARAYALQERVAEEDRAHRARVAAATEADAEARRITDLYTKAVEQVGSDKAPVRLGGFYALERLAQDNPGQRQTIVNVVSAYLRMPPAEDAQEREVRRTAQRLLGTHLRADAGELFWSGIDLDLTGATLDGFDLSRCEVRDATFTGASFTGTTSFSGTRFGRPVSFADTRFSGPAEFEDTTFTGRDSFHRAHFAGDVSFHAAHFAGIEFDHASFTHPAMFTRVRCAGNASFRRTTFDDACYFRHTEFGGVVLFQGTRFTGPASFSSARFADASSFRYARFADHASFRGVEFGVNVVFDKASFELTTNFEGTRFAGSSFDGTTFAQGGPPES
jgi:uncharacterized protein YjbI with pentapeptide repeats